MGVFNQMSDPNSQFGKLPIAKRVTSPDTVTRMEAFAEVLREMSAGRSDPQLADPGCGKVGLGRNRQDCRCELCARQFTTFAGSSARRPPTSEPAPRRDVPRHGEAAGLPISALESRKPEALWAWMDGLRGRGLEALAIPHNANASDGRMFGLARSDGKPIDAAYNAARGANEPLTRSPRSRARRRRIPACRPTTSSRSSSNGRHAVSRQ